MSLSIQGRVRPSHCWSLTGYHTEQTMETPPPHLFFIRWIERKGCWYERPCSYSHALSLEKRFWMRRELEDPDLSSKLGASSPQKMRHQKLVANTSCGTKSAKSDICPPGHWQTPHSIPKSRFWGTGLHILWKSSTKNVRREAEPPRCGLQADKASASWINPHGLVGKRVSQMVTLWNFMWTVIPLAQEMECLL